MSSVLLKQLSRISTERRRELLAEIKDRLARVRLSAYRPYAKQADFHVAGATYRERLLRAGNQLGKTVAGAAEAAYHLTGRYPEWWRGRRWDRPTSAWVGGVTGVSTRDNPQKMLMGEATSVGTGMIPAEDVAGYTTSRNVAEMMDTVRIRHRSGGISVLSFKSYDQDRTKWQGATLDFVWFDEEPPEEIYTEGLTRTNATGGIVWLTFTPLLGMSNVVRRFLLEGGPDRHDTNMVLEDAEHIPAARRAQIIASYPPHEREARTKGTPILGSGRIFPVAEESIIVEPFVPPKHWAQIGALDFGWDHPFAAVKLLHDTDADVVYVANAYRARESTPLLHAEALKPWGGEGQWMPWAWPHDGLAHDKGSGEQLSRQYRRYGLTMLPGHATFADGTNGVEAGLMEMLDRMQTGRFRVFSNLGEWFEEFRLYHRKDGIVVKLGDDLMSATRYGVMCLRFAAFRPASLLRHQPGRARSEYNPMENA